MNYLAPKKMLSCAIGMSIALAGFLYSENSVSADKKPFSASFDPPKPAKFAPDLIPHIELSGPLLFQLVASEIALQNQEPGAAYNTYMAMAVETADPRLAQRAVEIAQEAKAPNEIRTAVLLWNKLSPGNQKAQDLLIQVGIHFQEYNKILPTVVSYLSQVSDPEQEIQKIQAQLLLGNRVDKRQALSFFKRATDKFKKLTQTQLGLARLEALNGNYAVAEKHARAAFKDSPNTETVMTLTSVLLKNKRDEAKQLLDSYLKKNPTDLKVRDSYAQILLQTGDMDKLLNLAQNYIDDGNFNIAVAVSLTRQDKNTEAKQLLEKFIQSISSPLTPFTEEQRDKAYLLLCDIETENKNYDQALDHLSKVSGKLQPTARLQSANIYLKTNEPDKAKEVLNTLDSTGNPQLEEEILLAKSRLISATQNDKAALKFIENTVRRHPNSRTLNYEAAMLAERLDDLVKTEAYLKKAIAIDPNFANAYNSLGYTLLERTNRLQEAGNYIRKALSLEPNNPYILDSVGWLHFKEKRYKEAVNYLNDALQLLESEDIMLHLIEAYWVSNQKDEARLALKRALELWPDSDDISETVKRLGINR